MTLSFLALFTFATALFVTAVTPGPNVLALSARVLSGGVGSVIPFLVATWIGEILWLSAAFFGLTLIAETFQSVFMILKHIGIAYLLWLAWSMWHEPVNQGKANIPKRNGSFDMFFAGLTVSLGNPKIMVFYLALFPSLIDLSVAGLIDWVILTFAALIAMALADTIWMVSAHGARQFLRTPRAIRAINRIGATAMGSAAIIIATRN